MQHSWRIMLYYFKKGKNTTETHTQKICAVCGEGAMTDQMCQKWFANFCGGDFLLDGAPRSGRPVEVDRDQIENSQCYTTQDTADTLRISK